VVTAGPLDVRLQRRPHPLRQRREVLRPFLRLGLLLLGLEVHLPPWPPTGEQDVFRVDHFLAMTTVQNVLGSRIANRILEPVWNSGHIPEVEILREETLALEGRASYQDGVGALRTLVQNHLLQLMCLGRHGSSADARGARPARPQGRCAAGDPATDRAGRTDTEPPCPVRLRKHRRPRGPGLPGRVGRRPESLYRDLRRGHLQIDNGRWSGTTFRLRTGKAFASDREEVAVHFRPVPRLACGPAELARPKALRFGLQPEGVALDLVGTGPRPRTWRPSRWPRTASREACARTAGSCSMCSTATPRSRRPGIRGMGSARADLGHMRASRSPFTRLCPRSAQPRRACRCAAGPR
jgi:hypothetical protein